MRYIDANALMDALNVFKDRKNGNEHFMYGIETAKELLGIQPTVDAVPVVRCKECRWFKADEWVENAGYCISLNARIHPQITVEDWFCADGERRSE